jgi:hypothetical protein
VRLIEALRNSIGTIEKGLRDSLLYEHKGDRGEFRERVIEDFLRPFMPKCYGLGSGEVFSQDGAGSRQLDVVFYDDVFSTILFRDKNNQLFPCESVFGSVEVKSQLTTEELDTAIENVASLKRLERAPSDMLDLLPFRRLNVGQGLSFDKGVKNPYLGMVFTYDGLTAATVLDKLNKLVANPDQNKALLPDFIFNYRRSYMIEKSKLVDKVAQPAFLGEPFDFYVSIDTGQDTLPIFFLTMNIWLNNTLLRAPDLNAYWVQLVGQAIKSNPQLPPVPIPKS